VSHAGTCIGVRYKDRIGENDQRWRSVTLLPKHQEPVKNLREEEAPEALVNFFRAAR